MLCYPALVAGEKTEAQRDKATCTHSWSVVELCFTGRRAGPPQESMEDLTPGCSLVLALSQKFRVAPGGGEPNDFPEASPPATHFSENKREAKLMTLVPSPWVMAVLERRLPVPRV